MLDTTLKKVVRKAYFTTSFDRPTAKKGHEEEIAAARKAKVQKILRSKSKLGTWNGGKQRRDRDLKSPHGCKEANTLFWHLRVELIT